MALFDNEPIISERISDGWATLATLEEQRQRRALALLVALHTAPAATPSAEIVTQHLALLIEADHWHWQAAAPAAPSPRATWEAHLPSVPAIAETPAAPLVVRQEQDAAHYFLSVELAAAGRTLGRLTATRARQPQTHDFTNGEVALLAALAEPCAHALARAQRLAELEQLSFTDELTQLYNARYLRQYLAKELKRACRNSEAVAALFFDLDDFKQVNDAHGHLVGSHVLQECSELILTSVRETDIAGRYGGDEFIIILPQTALAAAAMVAERLRSRLAQHPFHGGQKLHLALRASFGVACYPNHAHTPQELITRADAAMYAAKANGKNRICFA